MKRGGRARSTCRPAAISGGGAEALRSTLTIRPHRMAGGSQPPCSAAVALRASWSSLVLRLLLLLATPSSLLPPLAKITLLPVPHRGPLRCLRRERVALRRPAPLATDAAHNPKWVLYTATNWNSAAIMRLANHRAFSACCAAMLPCVVANLRYTKPCARETRPSPVSAPRRLCLRPSVDGATHPARHLRCLCKGERKTNHSPGYPCRRRCGRRDRACRTPP